MNTMLASFVRTHWLMRASAQGLARHRDRLWRRLQPTLAATPALTPYVGTALEAMPISTPDEIRADYGRWNSLGLSHQRLHAAAQANEAGESGLVQGDVACGYSTGTSGTRGLFLASGNERDDYIGQSLARLLPLPALLRPQRIGLILRAGNDLYTDVGKAKRFAFKHFALALSDDALLAQVQAWQPSILIAPSHKLVLLAHAHIAGKLQLSALRHCFYGSEPMGGGERDWIGSTLGVRPDPIYQATEGFLAGACWFGRLHLNEHSLHVTKQPIAGTTAWQPIVTDLRRVSQPIVNLRLDDVLEDEVCGPCPCGYAGRTILPVMGRVSDLWRFGDCTILPRQISEAIEAHLAPGQIWQALGSPSQVTLHLPQILTPDAKAAVAHGVAAHLSLPCPVVISPEPPAAPSPKRRNILWQERANHGR
jgi:putative adenylate-forming enzyme